MLHVACVAPARCPVSSVGLSTVLSIRGPWVQVSHQMHTSLPCLLTCKHFGERQYFKNKSCNS